MWAFVVSCGASKKVTKEVWKDVPGYEGKYQASTMGRIRSLVKQKPGKFLILKQYPEVGGYLCVHMRPTGRLRKVHVIVLTAFVGPKPPKLCGAHLNGIRTDNRLENLKWCTYKENLSHKVLHGTHKEGESISWSKLTNHSVKCIRALYNFNSKFFYVSRLSRMFGVHHKTLRQALLGKTWKNI